MQKEALNHRFLTVDEAFAEFGERGLFHTPIWTGMLTSCMGYAESALLTCSGERPLMLTLLFMMRKGPFRFAGAPLPGSMTPYLDPIWPENIEEHEKIAAFRAQVAYLRREGYSYIEYRFRNYADAALLGEGSGLELSRPQTWMLDLTRSEEELWRGIKSRTRTKINKARRNGVTVEAIDTPAEMIPEFYEMLTAVFAKRGQKPGQPIACYRRLAEKMVPAKRALFLRCHVAGETATMGLFPWDSETIYYLSGASQPLGYRVESNALMHWEVIRFAREKGISRYDMGGRGIASIDRFKASFGAGVHDYGKLRFTTFPVRAAEYLYKKIHRIQG